ncbi:MAG: transposase [Candidatus Binatia bacterium]
MAASGWTQYSETQIREILELAKMGMQPADLARRYNVPVVVIHVWQTKYGSTAGETDASRLARLQSEIAKLNQLSDELAAECAALEAKLGGGQG